MPHAETPVTIRACVDARATAQGSAPFLVVPEPGLTLDYAGLRRRCRLVAAKLGALGLVAGDKVAFLLDNGLWSVSLWLGTMYAGLVTVPLNAVAGVTSIRHVLEHCDASVLFCSGHHRRQYEAAIAGCPRPITILETDEDTGPAWSHLGAPSYGSAVPVDPADDALLLYTSGTTGMPKGARLSHRAVLAGGRNTALAHRLTPADRGLCVLPLYHINGEIVTLMGPLVSGGSVVMPHRFHTSRFWDLVMREGCTWVSLVPTLIAYLMDRATRADVDAVIDFPHHPELRQLRFARSASAPLPASVQRRFEQVFGIPMIETMGLTETCAPILSNPLPPEVHKPGSPGIPFGNEVVVGDEQGRPVENHVAGELLVRGDNVLSGYYKDEAATQAAFRPGGWFRTGDIGYRDDDGYLFITGRLKELIIKGGENIAPREVDDVLYGHVAVLEAAAVGVPDEAYGQDVQACVCLREGVDADERELIEHCRRQLGPFKSPSRIHFLSELPKGPSGKIQRLKLPDIIAKHHDTRPIQPFPKSHQHGMTGERSAPEQSGDARGVHHDE